MKRPSLQALLDALPLSVYAVDRDLRITFSNVSSEHPRTCLGAKGRAPVLGSYFPDLLNEPERTRFVTTARTLLRGEALPTGIPAHIDVSAAGAAKLRVLIDPLPGPEVASGLLMTCIDTAGDHDPSHHGQTHDAARLDLARQLAATLNHEINNPLFIVSATLEDLLAEATDPGEQRRLRAALDAVWRVASAVKQLQEIRQIVTTPYVEGLQMVDLQASQEPAKERDYGEG